MTRNTVKFIPCGGHIRQKITVDTETSHLANKSLSHEVTQPTNHTTSHLANMTRNTVNFIPCGGHIRQKITVDTLSHSSYIFWMHLHLLDALLH